MATHGFGKAAAETKLASYEENLFLEVYGGWKPNYMKSGHIISIKPLLYNSDILTLDIEVHMHTLILFLK